VRVVTECIIFCQALCNKDNIKYTIITFFFKGRRILLDVPISLIFFSRYRRWQVKWIFARQSISLNICHLSTRMAKIWSPGTFLKMFGRTKFQLSISCSFTVMNLLFEVFGDFHLKFDNSEYTSDRELKFCVFKHL